MRVLHISDLHLRSPWWKVPPRAWLGKRLVGGANLLLLGRWRLFADAETKIAALATFRREIAADAVICTGDFTALGTTQEMSAAREAVAPLMDAPHGLIAVPGNHDYYARDVLRDRRFERSFGETITTDLPEHTPPGEDWPTVRLLGDEVAVVAVNSSRPQSLWSSSGLIPPTQLASLRSILQDARVVNRFVFVITHYGPRLPDGTPDTRTHGLENAQDLLTACALIPAGALLHGHIHHRYTLQVEGVAPPLFCAGSSTMAGREGLWVYDVEERTLQARPGHWNGSRYVLGS